MTPKMNEKRTAILACLARATNPMTLAEIGEAIGTEVKSGTTNALVAANLIRKVGTRKVAKTVYVEVAEYAIGEAKAE